MIMNSDYIFRIYNEYIFTGDIYRFEIVLSGSVKTLVFAPQEPTTNNPHYESNSRAGDMHQSATWKGPKIAATEFFLNQHFYSRE